MTALSTERLVLRPPRRADFEAYAAFYASDRTSEIGGPRDRDAAWRLFAADAGHWPLMGYGWFTLCEDGSETPIGTCGLHFPPGHGDVEIGWTLYDAGLGKGYATEAARAVLAWGFGPLGMSRIVSYISAANAASKRVAERLGASREATFEKDGRTGEVWVRAPAARNLGQNLAPADGGRTHG